MSVSTTYYLTDAAKIMDISPIGCPDLTKQENQSTIIVHTKTENESLKGKRVYIYFSGGTGRYTINAELQEMLLSKNITPVSAIAFPKIPSLRFRKNWSPVHNYHKDSDELELALDKVIELFGKGTEVVIAGHSRGAGALAIWLNTDRCKKYISLLKIKHIFINSPYGGSTTRTYYDGYHANRALVSIVNNTLDVSPTKVTYAFGRGDYTHTTRFVVENLRLNLTNTFVNIMLAGDDTYGHSGIFTDNTFFANLIESAFT